MRMHAMILASVMTISALFPGCASPSLGAQSAGLDSPSRPDAGPSLLSANGELFPLSTYFGVCLRNTASLRSKLENGMPAPHFPSYAEITGGGVVLKISVGKFGMMPGTKLEDVTSSDQSRRIQVGSDRSGAFVLVSNFGAGSNLVSIVYDESEDGARAEAIRTANNVVPCHLSVGQSKVNGL